MRPPGTSAPQDREHVSGNLKFATNSVDDAEAVCAAFGANHIVRQVPDLWVVVELEVADGLVECAKSVPPDQAKAALAESPDAPLAELFGRWLDVSLLLKDEETDDVARDALEDERARLAGEFIDTPAETLTGMRFKARVLLDLIDTAAEPDDPVHDFAASIAHDV